MKIIWVAFLSWVINLWVWHNHFWQMQKGICFSPVWIIKCVLRFAILINESQSIHEKTFSHVEHETFDYHYEMMQEYVYPPHHKFSMVLQNWLNLLLILSFKIFGICSPITLKTKETLRTHQTFPVLTKFLATEVTPTQQRESCYQSIIKVR